VTLPYPVVEALALARHNNMLTAAISIAVVRMQTLMPLNELLQIILLV
jgi:hypothetical protein